ncbi:unnamed protein product (macronuclear) [Paramecium tetraurelia]|uniref:RING-type domain-containing protein n=1 Tax=Paramecium tetraurelia TaxID=5888 RepID=A0C6C0_PARTE|nr:uncharacterized protein GSPATT00035466001 [Paramecium tetraurelia]CAK66337.1 unnamed protein product [Paramecium tetraurelia]|eukprot:XP_001433734.1 hypothetical protein (macronuclear) [Paramecium tetraurelia strain d4-2]
MSAPLFQISPIQKNILVLCNNFKNQINVGSSLDCALFIGLIEYHIKVNKVEDIKKIYEKAQLNSFGKIKTIISNSENQQQRLEYILKETKQSSKNLEQLMKDYFQNKGIPNEKDKDKDLKNKIKLLEQDFNIKLVICDTKSNPKIQEIGATTIYIYKSDPNYYILINAQENPILCSKCNGQQNLQKLKCNHQACFSCISNSFEAKNVTSVTCFAKGCQQKIEKAQYLQMKSPKAQDLKQQQVKQSDPSIKQSVNKVEMKQELQSTCQEEKKQLDSSNNQQLQSSSKIEQSQGEKNVNQESGQLQQSIKIQQGLEKQQKSQIQQTEQPLKLESSNNVENPSKNSQSAILSTGKRDNNPQNQKQDEFNAPKQIKGKQCSNCLKECMDQIFEASCGHCYCPKCAQILKSKNQQYTCLHPKCSKKNQYQFESKCNKCGKVKDPTILFTNFCGHQICVQCLEGLVRNLKKCKCPVCFQSLQENDIELFFENLQLQIIEKEMQKSSIIEYESGFEQLLLQSNNSKYCTFCNSPFTEYNLQQQLSHCQNHLHAIGVCCSIFPLECPQCQLPSLEISKYKITFEIGNYFEQNTLN